MTRITCCLGPSDSPAWKATTWNIEKQIAQPKKRDFAFDFVFVSVFCFPWFSTAKSVTPRYRSERAVGYFPLGPPNSNSLLAASMLSSRELRFREGLQERAACTSFKPSAPYRTNSAVASLLTSIRYREREDEIVSGIVRQMPWCVGNQYCTHGAHTTTWFSLTHINHAWSYSHAKTTYSFCLIHVHTIHFIFSRKRTLLKLVHTYTQTNTDISYTTSFVHSIWSNPNQG